MKPATTSASGNTYADSIAQNIDGFLRHATKKSLLIKGPWGAGKTYFWNNYITERIALANVIQERKYAYVSLFGLRSVDEVEQVVLTNSSLVGTRNRVEKTANATRHIIPWIAEAPWIKDFPGTLKRIGSLFLKDTLVCIDDLERVGNHEMIAEVMGFISVLKERNNCRIVLLSNDEAIRGEGRSTYDLYHEKVIDQVLPYAPPPEACVKIVFGSLPDCDHLAELAGLMSLVNIRVLRQACWLMEDVGPDLVDRHPDTIQLVRDHIFMLTAFIREESLGVDVSKLPRDDLLQYYNSERDEKDESTKALHSKLRAWGYESSDCDAAILDLLRDGSSDRNALRAVLDAMDQKYGQKHVRSLYENMWRLYSGNFTSTADAVLKAFCDFLDQYAGWLSEKDLEQCVNVVTTLGGTPRPAWQDVFVKHHIARADIKLLAKLEARTQNQEVRQLIDARRLDLERGMTIFGTMKQVVVDSGWNPDMVAYLQQYSAEEYAEALVREDDPIALRYISQFADSWANAAAGEREVVARLAEALEIIKRQSPLHSIRAEWILRDLRGKVRQTGEAE
jgi:hypothetical protein